MKIITSFRNYNQYWSLNRHYVSLQFYDKIRNMTYLLLSTFDTLSNITVELVSHLLSSINMASLLRVNISQITFLELSTLFSRNGVVLCNIELLQHISFSSWFISHDICLCYLLSFVLSSLVNLFINFSSVY
jgi:hypothetical protein